MKFSTTPWLILLPALFLFPARARAQADGHAPDRSIQGAATRWNSWRNWRRAELGKKAVLFPLGDVFSPPLADPKQPRFNASWQYFSTDFGHFSMGSASFGENIGLVRWPGRIEGDGWQLGVSGGVFALFNLDAESHDLLNADYIIGFPLSVRHAHWSARARLYHQSSHLGDEFLLQSQPLALTRINLSFESLEALVSWDNAHLRIYGGPTRIISTVTPLERNRLQFGAEYRGEPRLGRNGCPIAGIEWSTWDENSWKGNIGIKAGMLFSSPFEEARTIRLFLEHYSGRIPHGQFYKLSVRYSGFGFEFSL